MEVNIQRNKVEKWMRSLERSLSDTLGSLIPKIEQAFKNDDRIPAETSVEIIGRLGEISRRRNALCHGAWVDFDERGGAKLLYFVRNKEGKADLRSDQVSTEDIAAIRCETVSMIHRLVEVTQSIGVRFAWLGVAGCRCVRSKRKCLRRGHLVYPTPYPADAAEDLRAVGQGRIGASGFVASHDLRARTLPRRLASPPGPRRCATGERMPGGSHSRLD